MLSSLIIVSLPSIRFLLPLGISKRAIADLVDKGITKIALTGDSAGGNLALVLLSIASAQASKGSHRPSGRGRILSGD